MAPRRQVEVRGHSVSLEPYESVVVHPSNRSRSRSQDVGLAVPPDLTDDALPLLQPLRPLQFLGGSKHVHAQGPVRLAGVIADRYLGAGRRDGGLDVFAVLVFPLLVLVYLLSDLLQVLLLRCGGGHLGSWLARNTNDQEAECQHQAETHSEHKVQAEALRVC